MFQIKFHLLEPELITPYAMQKTQDSNGSSLLWIF